MDRPGPATGPVHAVTVDAARGPSGSRAVVWLVAGVASLGLVAISSGVLTVMDVLGVRATGGRVSPGRLTATAFVAHARTSGLPITDTGSRSI